MAFSMHSNRKTAMSEINVTPLVDVMLVLLIIFMVTAPMMQEGLSVELPETKGSTLESPNQKIEPVNITLLENGAIDVNGSHVPEDKLEGTIQEAMKQDPKRPVYLRGDKGVLYGRVAMIMGTLMNAGIKDISLITSPPKESSPTK